MWPTRIWRNYVRADKRADTGDDKNNKMIKCMKKKKKPRSKTLKTSKSFWELWFLSEGRKDSTWFKIMIFFFINQGRALILGEGQCLEKGTCRLLTISYFLFSAWVIKDMLNVGKFTELCTHNISTYLHVWNTCNTCKYFKNLFIL